jgi:hypothetical protein
VVSGGAVVAGGAVTGGGAGWDEHPAVSVKSTMQVADTAMPGVVEPMPEEMQEECHFAA